MLVLFINMLVFYWIVVCYLQQGNFLEKVSEQGNNKAAKYGLREKRLVGVKFKVRVSKEFRKI